MSTIKENLEGLISSRNTIRTKAVAMGLATDTAKLADLASAISSKVSPVNGGTYDASAQRSFAAGSYLKTAVTVNAATVDDLTSTMKQTKTVTPSTSDQTISADSGKLLSSVTVKGVSVPSAGDIVAGQTVSSNETKLVSGTMPKDTLTVGIVPSAPQVNVTDSIDANGYHINIAPGSGAINATVHSNKADAGFTGKTYIEVSKQSEVASKNSSVTPTIEVISSTTKPFNGSVSTSSGVTTITLGAGAYTAAASKISSGTASNTVTGMVTTTSSPYYVTLSTTSGSARATATVGTAGYLATGSKTNDVTVDVTGAGVIYIKQGSVTPTTSNYVAPTAKVSTSGISSDAISSSATTHYVKAVQDAAGSVKGTATVTEGYVKPTNGGSSDAKFITIADSTAVYLKDASITPTKGTLSTTMETVATGGYTVSSGTSKVVVGAGYTDGATKDVTPTTIRIKGSTTTNNGVVTSAPAGSTHIQPTEKITISKGYVENDIVIYGEKADVADEATAAEGVSVSITNSHDGITPVLDATNSRYDIKKDISVSTSVTKDGWWGGSKTATASNVILGAIPKLTYSVTGNAASVSANPTASASVTACTAIKTATSGSFYLTYAASASSGEVTAKVPTQTVTLNPGYSTGDTVTVTAKSATFAPNIASKSGVTYIQAGVIGATASVTDVTIKKDTDNSTLPTNSSRGTDDYVLKVVKDDGGALTYSGLVTTEGYVNSSKNTSKLTGTAGVTAKEFYVSKGAITGSASVSAVTLKKKEGSTLPTITKPSTGTQGLDYYHITVDKNTGGVLTYSASVSTEGYVNPSVNNTGSLTGTAASVTANTFYVAKGTPVVDCSVSSGSASLDMGGISTHTNRGTEDYAIVLNTTSGSATGSATVNQSGYVEKPAEALTTTKSVAVTGSKTVYVSKAAASKTSMSFTDDGGYDSVTISAGYNPSDITITGSCKISRISEAWISSNLF